MHGLCVLRRALLVHAAALGVTQALRPRSPLNFVRFVHIRYRASPGPFPSARLPGRRRMSTSAADDLQMSMFALVFVRLSLFSLLRGARETQGRVAGYRPPQRLPVLAGGGSWGRGTALYLVVVRPFVVVRVMLDVVLMLVMDARTNGCGAGQDR